MPKKTAKSVSTETQTGAYTAKITGASREHSLPDNVDYIDVRFDILLDGKVVAERRLAFPLGTTEEAITEQVKKYCQMFEEDNTRAAEVKARSEAEAEADSVLKNLKGKEI